MFPGSVLFFWNEPNATTPNILQGAIAYNGSGWGGVAFASTPQVMANSNALIVANNPGSPNGTRGCVARHPLCAAFCTTCPTL